MEQDKSAKYKTHDFSNRQEARMEMEKWKKELPVVSSSYKASGKLPIKALVLLFAGAILGFPLGGIAGTLVAAGAYLCSSVILKIESVFQGIPILGGLVGLVTTLLSMLIIPIITYVCFFIAVGSASASIVIYLGRIGKNRNPLGTAFFAAGSALPAAIFSYFITSKKFLEYAALEPAGGLGSFLCFFGTTTGVLFFLGLFIALVSAGALGGYLVASAKFCESCLCFMKSQDLQPLSFATAREVVKHLNNSSLSCLSEVRDVSLFNDVIVKLFYCQKCNAGYVELTIKFSGRWPKEGQAKTDEVQYKDMSVSWLVASRALTPVETMLLKNCTWE